MRAAVARRAELFEGARRADPATTAFRVFHRAADGDDGLAVDAYDRFLVAHLYRAIAPEQERALLDALAELGFEGVYVKRHPRQKNELGQEQVAELAPNAPAHGRAAPEELVIREHGVPFGVRLHEGLRTGLFLDQRGNRRRVCELSEGKRVLNLFSYTGGFAVAALSGGAAEVLCVDSSPAAVARARQNVARIGAQARHRVWADDAFDVLRRLGKREERFDLVIVDPPSYSTTRARRFVIRKDYPQLCEAALRVLGEGGALLACLNHHQTTSEELRRFVVAAAAAERRGVERFEALPGGIDFPTQIADTAELKSALVRIS